MIDALAVVSSMLGVVLAGLVALGPERIEQDDPRPLPSGVGPGLVVAAILAVVAVVRATDDGAPTWLALATPAPALVFWLVTRRPAAVWWARTAGWRAASVGAFALPLALGALAAT